MVLTENLKKIILAGIGTVASTAEKSRELLDEMVKKGELTVDQAKILNSDLAKNLKDKSQNIVSKSQDIKDSILEKTKKKKPEDDFGDFVANLSNDQLASLKEHIASFEASLAKVGENVSAAAGELIEDFTEEDAETIVDETCPTEEAEEPIEADMAEAGEEEEAQ